MLYDAATNTYACMSGYLLQVPCTPQVTACNNAVVNTSNPTGAWNYSEVGGELSFGPEDLPTSQKQQTAWKGLQSYSKKEYCASNGTTVFSLKTATHICSYLCKVRQLVFHHECRSTWQHAAQPQLLRATELLQCADHANAPLRYFATLSLFILYT